MTRWKTTSPFDGVFKHLLLIGYLAVCFCLLQPATSVADPPEPDYQGPEKCVECHSEEVQSWRYSSHANALTAISQSRQAACNEEEPGVDCSCLSCHATDFNPAASTYAYAGVTCEACHGPYIEGHPDDGVMKLVVDSSICGHCHGGTYEHWERTPHAKADVQCIGCHRVHPQDLRVSDEMLCRSCHLDRFQDAGHAAHLEADVACLDCHASPDTKCADCHSLTNGPIANSKAAVETGMAPAHDFRVATSVCIECHERFFHEDKLPVAAGQVSAAQMIAQTDPLGELTAMSETGEQTTGALGKAMAIGLGVGVGIGGILGAIFLLIGVNIWQGRAKK
jgi:hypothetical protein